MLKIKQSGNFKIMDALKNFFRKIVKKYFTVCFSNSIIVHLALDNKI